MHQTETIRTKDGRQITASIYKPGEEVKKVIVVAPSVELTQDYYYDLSVYLVENNIAVITFDFRGTGLSAPKQLKGFSANLEHWAQQDLDAVLRHAKNNFPKQELIFMGHGIGGEIIGLAAASQFISRIVLVNCALSCTRLRRWREKIWIVPMKEFVTIVTWLYGYFPGKRLRMMKNLPKGVMDEWIQWCNNENGLFDDFSDYNYRKLQVSLLAFSFSDDWRSQQSGVRALLDHFTSASIQWYHIKPSQLNAEKIGHSGFFKTRFKKDLWCRMLQWIEDEKNENAQPCLKIKSFHRASAD
ncbi:MAG TPA: alpha/beta fold hydrolase [Chitinophagaceae bacterium]